MQFLKGETVMDFPIYEFFVSKQTMAVMLSVYLVMIVVLRKFMKGRAPFALNGPMKFYNTVQVALNVYMIYGLIVLSSVNNIFGLNEKYTARCDTYCTHMNIPTSGGVRRRKLPYAHRIELLT